MAMKNTIRGCIACILPCGALDVIRIVHANGRVEEITGSIRACEVMKAHPKHVLRKPSSRSYNDESGVVDVPRIVIVPPDAELQRGKIYFLMPVPSSSSSDKKAKLSSGRASGRRTTKKKDGGDSNFLNGGNLLVSNHYIGEIVSEKQSSRRERRKGRVSAWRPHLESISETTTSDLIPFTEC